MEEILILLFQFLIEVVGQILLELPWDMAVSGKADNGTVSAFIAIVLSLVAGLAVGALTLVVHPQTLIHSGTLRMANLVVGPATSAGSAWLVSRRRNRRGAEQRPALHSACAFCFTFGLVAVRFTYGHHPV